MPARTIYVDPRVHELTNCRERCERMRPHVRCDEVRELDEEARDRIERRSKRRHGKDDFGDDAVFVFDAWDDALAQNDRYYHFRPGRSKLATQGIHCQDAMELNPVFGCPFRCAYCGFGRTVHVTLDVERFMSRLPELFAEYPDQELWKYSNMTDLPPFEPEYGAVAPMVRYFAERDGRYLMLFTKSNDTDFLLGLRHGGHTIVSWSLSSATVSREVDRWTASMAERIEAMARCHEAGYHVRARLSPIVPVKGWRDEYREMLEMLFAHTEPDLVTLEMLGWFDFEDLPLIVPEELLDPSCYGAARSADEQMRGHRKAPFPFEVRREVYAFCIDEVQRISPQTRVSICHGTPRMWDALGEKIGMCPEDFVCNCGPTSTELNPLLSARTPG
jgi:spore photoproduct lyase